MGTESVPGSACDPDDISFLRLVGRITAFAIEIGMFPSTRFQATVLQVQRGSDEKPPLLERNDDIPVADRIEKSAKQMQRWIDSFSVP